MERVSRVRIEPSKILLNHTFKVGENYVVDGEFLLEVDAHLAFHLVDPVLRVERCR